MHPEVMFRMRFILSVREKWLFSWQSSKKELQHEHRSIEAFSTTSIDLCAGKLRKIQLNRCVGGRENDFFLRQVALSPSNAAKRSFREILCSSCGQNERGKYFDATEDFRSRLLPMSWLLFNIQKLMAINDGMRFSLKLKLKSFFYLKLRLLISNSVSCFPKF